MAIFELEKTFPLPFLNLLQAWIIARDMGLNPAESSTSFRVRHTPLIKDDFHLNVLHLLLYSNVFFYAVPRDTKVGPESFENREHVRRTKGDSV